MTPSQTIALEAKIALSRSMESEMKKWIVIFEQQYSENTPEYGYGDYPDQIEYIGAVVEGDTVRKAQNAVKKVFPRTRFGGMFSPRLIEADSKEAKRFMKPADARLREDTQRRHQAALEKLGR
jgi:hypothetical protein